MAQDVINTGAVANDGTGDAARTAFTKIKTNFTELYKLHGSIGLVGDGSQDNRAALAAYDTSLGAGEALILAPGTYVVNTNLTISHVVQFRPGAKIKPASGVTVTFSKGYDATDYQHVIDISAGGAFAVTETYRSYITPQHAGAKADRVQDDTTHVKAAISALGAPTRAGTGTLFFPRGYYKLTECLNIQDRITMYGETGTSFGRPLSVLIWPPNCCGIIFHAHNTTADSLGYNHALKTAVVAATGPSGLNNGFVMGLGSVIKHLTLLGNNGATPAATAFDWATHGLRLKHGGIDATNLHVAYWHGNGIMIRGNSGTVGPPEYEGGPNLCCLKDITVLSNAGSGLYVDGQDSNAGYFIAINADGNQGWGIWDNSFLGNTYIACHTNANRLGSYFAYDANARNVFVGCYEEGSYTHSDLKTPTVHLGGYSRIGINGTAYDSGNFPGPKIAYVKNQSGLGSITVTAAGSGYTSAPTVTFSAPSGAVQATATATIIGANTFAGGIGAITMTNVGAGYSTVPNAVITGDGAGATLKVLMNDTGGIKAITVIDLNYTDRVGHDYTTASVVIDAPTSTTATGTAYLNASGGVSHIHITNRGAGYTTAPTISFSGGGGSGAAATCTLAGAIDSPNTVYINDVINTNGDLRALGFSRRDVSPADIRWELMEEAWTGDLYWQYQGVPRGIRVTGPNTTNSFGRSVVVPFASNFINGIWLNSSRQLSYSAAMPTSGEYAKGDFVHNSNISELGSVASKYIILGWSRLVTGTAHVLNTDWLEARCLTGN